MKQYETMVIIDSMVTDQVIQDELQAIESTITADGEIIKVDKWGKRKMAYEIDRKSHGFYAVFYYNAESSVIEKLEANFRINDNIIRWISLKDQPLPVEVPEETTEVAEEAAKPAAEETAKPVVEATEGA
ncbi:MAG: 30S ribosomal protein S6 [Fibrobacterales bacterium]